MPDHSTCRLALRTFRPALFFASLLACLPAVFSQKNKAAADFSPRFEVFTLPGGVLGNSVQAIVQDSAGFLWFGSQEGLHRYDGTGFFTYRNEPNNPNSIASDYIESIFLDSKGILWLAHWNNGGLTAFDPATEKFTRYFQDSDNPASLSGNTISVIAEDWQGYVWFGGQTGLNRFDRKTGKFKHFRHDPNDLRSLSHDQVRALYVDKKGTLWVGTGFPWSNNNPAQRSGGLNRFDPKSETFTRFLHDPNNPQSLSHNVVRGLLEDSRGNFWVGTGGDGLHLMNREKGTFTRLPYDPKNPGKLSRPWLKGTSPAAQPSDAHVTSLFEDRDGRIWITAIFGGLNVFEPDAASANPASGTVRHFENLRGEGNLTTNFLWQVFQSTDGVVWIVTAGGGFTVYKVSNEDFRFPFFLPYPSTSSPGGVSDVVKDKAGNVWVSYFDDPDFLLLRHDRKTGKTVRFPNGNNSPGGLNARRIHTLYPDRDSSFQELGGCLWVGTDNGLFRYEPDGSAAGTFRHFLNPLTSNISVHYLLQDSKGIMWACSWGIELNRLDPKTGKYTVFRHDRNDPASIGGRDVSGLYEDAYGNIWVSGGAQNDIANPLFLDRFHPDKMGAGGRIAFTHFIKEKRAGTAEYLTGDDDGNLWFLDALGSLQKLNPATGTLQRFTPANSNLPSNSLTALAKAKNGKFWLNADGGFICEFDPKTNQFTTYGKRHGIETGGRERSEVFVADDGEVLIGRRGGYVAFYPDSIRREENSRVPLLRITDFRLFDERVVPGSTAEKHRGILQKPIWQTSTLRLAHDQNIFSFSVSCFDFNDPAGNQLQFMLENYDLGWRNDLRNGETPSYVNVLPGEYTFRVRGANSLGAWNMEGVSLKIKILPPWWKSWWAYSIYGLLILTGIFFFDRFQRQRIVQRERRKILQRELEQAKEIEKAYAELQQKNRELEIEAALERVRSHTMAMHQSNDLLNVITVVGVELHQIGIPFDWVNILTDVVRKEGLTAWQTVLGLPEPLKVYIPYFDNVLFKTIEELSTNHVELWSYSLNEYELKSWFGHVFSKTTFINLPDELKQKRLSAKSCDISIVALKNNVFLSLAIHDGVPYTEEQNNIIKRFGKVFEQAYTRFLDLQKAESQAVDLVREKQQLEKTLTELRATQSQLIQSEKLASLGELTAGIAHEIQNPLNFVNNFSELSVDLANEINEELEKEPVDKTLVKELMGDLTQNQQKINHHGKRASSIVTGMLQHARTSTGKKEPTDLNALADEYLRLAYHGLRAKDSTFNAKMVTDFDPTIGKVEVVPQDIGRVFLNLLNNAFYATQQRQKLEMEKVEIPYEPTVSVSSKKTDGGVEFRIRDNGTGIPEAVKAKIFQPFFTTKPTGQGTGLGLSLVYDIVMKGHGGTLEVETKEGVGTEFVVQMPAKTNE